MSVRLLFFCLLLSLSCFAQTTNFNSDWYFSRDSIQSGNLKNDNVRSLQLPHDWSVEDLPNQSKTVIGPFTADALNKKATGFTEGGTGFYAKKIITGQDWKGKKIFLHFDGVYMNSEVYVNGHLLGKRPNGYVPFTIDMSDYLLPEGKENFILVKVNNTGKNSRWYSGSGIYRPVSLIIANMARIAENGIFISTPKVSEKKSEIVVKTSVINDLKSQNQYEILTEIYSPKGKKLVSSKKNISFGYGGEYDDIQSFTVEDSQLWSPETPNLYKAVTTLKAGKKIIDKEETSFGIRSIEINAAKGFLLNGKSIKLKGGNIHHDNGILGAAAHPDAEERKITILKDNGYNAIRLSHNPSSKTFLEICDRLGMLVIDEAFDMWERSKNRNDYHLYFKDWWQKDLQAMILRDRNHPSVIMWSIGNEIYERAEPRGLEIGKELVKETKRLDPTRPVTEAICAFTGADGEDWDKTPPAFALLDVGGYNYQWKRYEEDHQKYPDRIMYGSETFPLEAWENWEQVEKHPYVIGDFVWTAMDYLGEAGIGNAEYRDSKNEAISLNWPWINGWCGDFDFIGEKKPQSYYRDVVWKNKSITMLVHEPIPNDKLEIVSKWGWPKEFPSWNWEGNEGKKMKVRVFSRASKVRLKLNGETVSEKMIDPKKGIIAEFEIQYKPGELTAVNVVNGKETDAFSIKTTGKVAKLALHTETKNTLPGKGHLSFITAELKDKDGNVVHNQDQIIQFQISANGKILATGNSNPKEPQSYQQNQCKTFYGKCLIVVESTIDKGNIVIVATTHNLPKEKLNIKIK